MNLRTGLLGVLLAGALLPGGCRCNGSDPPPDATAGDGGGGSDGGAGDAAATDAAPSDGGGSGLSCADEGLTECTSAACAAMTDICVGQSPTEACCRVECDPMASPDTCPMGTECRALVDTMGNPTGDGACFAVGAIGDPCSPERCAMVLVCVGSTADDAICRETCDPMAMAPTCMGQTACVALTSMDPPGACLPAGALGDPCSPEPCVAGTVCTGPDSDTAFCRAECDPMMPACPMGFVCTPFSAGTATGACLPM